MARYQDVVGLDVAVYKFESMKMPKPTCYLSKSFLGFEGLNNRPELITIRVLDDVRERTRTELEGDIQEVGMGLLVVVSDNMGMVVALLQDADFPRCESDEVLQETFHCHSAPL